ncbi:hypothetical protein DES44_3745 [Roseateles depolymerans]|uniref:Uncharacterized protein n=1 Tax=Roseateles depolymerans TaxID=76731 RepID=A0A0U3L0A3_9BURK|nr:hypothetical protein RD2015_247 [Roseateles depolymerans]REG15239.1 hypothetical protein DES44_3745 [Roseateles depolymerans]
MRPEFPIQPPYYAVIFRSQRTPSRPDDGQGTVIRLLTAAGDEPSQGGQA